jgi:hypothetical protein
MLIIAEFIWDYEKQVLIIDIKSEQQCAVCHVSSKKRKNLQDKWFLRTHESTKRQIQKKRITLVNQKDDDWMHDMINFAWNHHLINIHETIMMNMLHQLYKRMIMHLFIWIQMLLKIEMSTNRKRKRRAIRKKNLSELNQLNIRFRNVSQFTDLKIFFKFTKVKQWTEEEQKTIVQQIISIITSLLIKKWSHVIDFTKVLMNFILIAQYRSHDESTLKYLNHVFSRINFFKKVFRQSRSIEQNIEEDHFNFLKFHVISHYSNFIRKFEASNEYDTFHDEARHKYMIKEFYHRTNKRETFQAQLIEHNNRRLSILTTKNIKRHATKKSRDKKIKSQHTRVSRDSLNLRLIDIVSTSINQRRHKDAFEASKNWCSIEELSEIVQISNLMSASTAFVRKKRLRRTRQFFNSRDRFRRESDFIWIKNFEICPHDSLICWIRNENNSLDTEELMQEHIRFKFDWQNRSDFWRRNHVWVRKEFSNQTFFSISSEKKLIEQIFCILSIRDSECRNEKNKSYVYSDVLLNIKRSRRQKKLNKIIEMIELKNWRGEIARHSRNLRANRIYDISNVIRSVHVISDESGHYYVNNYVNWNTYNTIYDEDFMKSGITKVEMYKKSCQ